MQNNQDSQPSKQDEQVSQFSKHVHSYIRDYINLADQKAAFIFTVGTALLAFLNQIGITKVWEQGLTKWTDALAIVSLLSIGLSVLLAILVVVPNLSPGSGRRGYIFWESIMRYGSPEQYLDDVETKQAQELNRAMLEHCYALARICQRKYKYLRYGIVSGAVGVFLTLILLIFT